MSLIRDNSSQKDVRSPDNFRAGKFALSGIMTASQATTLNIGTLIPTSRLHIRHVRVVLILLWTTIILAAVAAPCLKASGMRGPAAALYLLTAPVCHQNPARSFSCYGYGWAVCHRCSGIYAGLLLGAFCSQLLSVFWYDVRRRRIGTLAGILPVFLDYALPFAGVWVNTPASRFASGMAFGLAAGVLLVPAVAEVWASLHAGTRPVTCPDIQGDLR
jgi:uncharacterized membrane protein